MIITNWNDVFFFFIFMDFQVTGIEDNCCTSTAIRRRLCLSTTVINKWLRFPESGDFPSRYWICRVWLTIVNWACIWIAGRKKPSTRWKNCVQLKSFARPCSGLNHPATQSKSNRFTSKKATSTSLTPSSPAWRRTIKNRCYPNRPSLLRRTIRWTSILINWMHVSSWSRPRSNPNRWISVQFSFIPGHHVTKLLFPRQTNDRFQFRFISTLTLCFVAIPLVRFPSHFATQIIFFLFFLPFEVNLYSTSRVFSCWICFASSHLYVTVTQSS